MEMTAVLFRFYQELSYKEEERKDNFIAECIADPSVRDKLSLVTRSFKNRIKVRHEYIALCPLCSSISCLNIGLVKVERLLKID